MDILLKAMNFWTYQKQTEIEYNKMELKNKETQSRQTEKQYNEKLVEAHNTINIMSHKISTMKEEMDRTKKDFAELQDKYTERTRQKRKLGELYESLKRHSESDGNQKPNIQLQKDDKSMRISKSPSNSINNRSPIPRSRDTNYFPKNHDVRTKGFQPRSLFQRRPDFPVVQDPKAVDRFSMIRRSSPLLTSSKESLNLKAVNNTEIPFQRILFSTPKRSGTPFERRFALPRRDP
eukprot:TRINITY_DN389_c0_g1_i4.p1 TRINITY_DN389_c0_g1~~TRINITY_DN389_c0_g1_i4.p1  ORF type:complete len:235 (-),score=44.70 TRINITY_DN389_c0_g1_i4:23-727(-)